MFKITKSQKTVFALMMVLPTLLLTVGCASKNALVEDASPESEASTYTEENVDTLKTEMQNEIDRLTAENDALKAEPQEDGISPYTVVQLSAAAPSKPTNGVTAIAFNKSTDLVMNVGDANQRAATTTPAGKAVSYTSSDTKVATVDASGFVFCKAPGKTVITASSGKKSASYQLTVIAAKAAPANAAAANAGKSGALVGYNITVYDTATPAVTGAGHTIPIDKYYFYSADGKQLGYMLGNEQIALMGKSKVKTERGWVAPGFGGNWEAWLAQQFNLYRGLDGKMGANAGGLPNTGTGGSDGKTGAKAGGQSNIGVIPQPGQSNGPLVPRDKNTSIEDLRNEVIRLTNIERKKVGKAALIPDKFTMDYAQIRAEECSISFSHTRPNNGDDMPGGLSFMENIHFGSSTASGAVRAWMNSKGHRATMLSDYSDYGNRFGVGVYEAPNGSLFWVQEFVLWDPEDNSSAEDFRDTDYGGQNRIDTYTFRTEAIRLINNERVKAGLPKFIVSKRLMDYAQVRAKELVINFSHTRPDGSSSGTENASYGRNTPTAAVDAWMNSKGHRANILTPASDPENGVLHATHIGVGCYVHNGIVYWAMDLGYDSEDDGGAQAIQDTNDGGGILRHDGGNSASTDDLLSDGENIVNNAPSATYSINATELNLTAGEGYQLSVDTSGSANDMRVEWSVPSIASSVLSVDDSGNVTTYYRGGMTSAKATVTVSAKVYVSDKLAKTLHCKIFVTQ